MEFLILTHTHNNIKEARADMGCYIHTYNIKQCCSLEYKAPEILLTYGT